MWQWLQNALAFYDRLVAESQRTRRADLRRRRDPPPCDKCRIRDAVRKTYRDY